MARRKKVGGSNLQFSDSTRKAFARGLLNDVTMTRIIQTHLAQMLNVDTSVGGMVFTPKEKAVLNKAFDKLDDVIRIQSAVGHRAKNHARLEL